MKNFIKIIYTNSRHVFYRGEKINFSFSLMNFFPYNINDCKLRIYIDNLWEKDIIVPVVSPFIEILSVDFNSNLYKSGNYILNVELSNENKILSSEKFEFIIVPCKKNENMQLWHWPATVHYNALEVSFDTAKEQLDLLASLGYTWAQFRANWALNNPKEAIKIIEYAMTLNIELGILIENANGGVFKLNSDTSDDAKLISFNGEVPNLANSQHTAIIRRNKLLIESLMMRFKDFPSCSTVFMNSEVEDKLKLPYDAISREQHEKILGFSLDKVRRKDCIFDSKLIDGKFLQQGVIADDDYDYCYARYYFKHGDTFVPTNKLMGESVHYYRPDVTVITDPLRNCSVYNRFDGVDVVSSWTYTNPDPKAMLFVETLIQEAKPLNQQVIHTITLWNYAGTLVPCGENRFAREQTLRMGPDQFIETAWINFSRGPKAIGTYLGSPIELTLKNGDPFIFSPETENAIKKFSEEVLKPLGEFARETIQKKRKIAVLDSFASRVYGVSPASYAHYPNYSVYNFYTVLNMAHFNADIIFDETIELYGVDNYDVLVLPVCDTLTESVYKKIKKFAENGGIVIADQYLRAEIPNVIRFDFDFDYRKRVNANANTKNMDFAEKDDTIFRNSWNTIEVKGVTAEEDQKILEKYTRVLRDNLDEKIKREFDCSSPRLLLNAREFGGVDYLFVVNDNRTWGERVARWKSLLEKSLTETATISILDKGFKPVVYDIITQRRFDVQRNGDYYEFELSVEANCGAILAIYPKEYEKLNIQYTPLVKGEECKVNIDCGIDCGLQPLEVIFKSSSGINQEYSNYYLAKNGKCEITFTPALNDNLQEFYIIVKDLTTGIVTTLVYD